jgi:hypothetical protein
VLRSSAAWETKWAKLFWLRLFFQTIYFLFELASPIKIILLFSVGGLVYYYCFYCYQSRDDEAVIVIHEKAFVWENAMKVVIAA